MLHDDGFRLRMALRGRHFGDLGTLAGLLADEIDRLEILASERLAVADGLACRLLDLRADLARIAAGLGIAGELDDAGLVAAIRDRVAGCLGRPAGGQRP